MTDSVASVPTSSDERVNSQIVKFIEATITRLRQLTQRSVQSNWRIHLGDLPVGAATRSDTWLTWEMGTCNARDHVAWVRGQQVLWLGQRIVIPPDLQGYPLEGLTLRLSLIWWAQLAEVFVNGELVQAGDLFDTSARIVLSTNAQPGEAIAVALRLVSPGHDDGALVRSLCLYERADGVVNPCPEPGFIADELAVLQHYLTQFAPDQLEGLAKELNAIDWSSVGNRSIFERSLTTLREQLQSFGTWIKQRQIALLGHAHLDLAWLWTVDETWDAAERTFNSVLNLQKDFPELIFCHSSPVLYEWVERNRPELFTAIQQRVAEGRWEVAAGLWVEPELNVVSGESIARQVLYGQHYTEAKFGKVSAIAWLPDSFGFCWQLPQILTQGEITYFVTQKLRWNDSTQFPYEWFQWRSPDGSEILSFNSPPIGEGIDPVKMAHYAVNWEAKTGIPMAQWLTGVGDHGGGPTRDMLTVARRWQQSPFFPTLSFNSAEQYLVKIEEGREKKEIQEVTPHSPLPTPYSLLPTPHTPHPTPHTPLPVWNNELYLEFHRGCYTTHADQKLWNRRCERSLYQAELFASIATLLTGATYPKAELETAWKKVLFNQFHDILPGSAIPEVYEDADPEWQTALQTATSILKTSLEAIAAHIAPVAPPQPHSYPVLVINSLNWARSEVVAIALPHPPAEGYQWQVCTPTGESLLTQVEKTSLYCLTPTIPGIGYTLLWLCQCPISAETPDPAPAEWTMENDYVRVEVDPTTGNLARVFDKVYQREVLSAPGNQLQAFRDSGQYWDAWNIDPNYAQHALPEPILTLIEWVEWGAIAQRIQVRRMLGQSEFCQDYVLTTNSSMLKIETTVDWQERAVMVKAAFPLNVTSDRATYEIPFGAIARPTRPTTPHDKAKWEVPALQWADLGDDEYGVSLLNDCKHGYDSQPSQLRLTLLRSASWPNPNADRGMHQFTYALYPHGGDWRSAETVHRGYELNQPLHVNFNPAMSSQSGTLPPVGQFLNLEVKNLILSAFKQSEDSSNRWILRGYECHGESALVNLANTESALLNSVLDLPSFAPTNLLERQIPESQPSSAIALNPWKIITLSIPT
ncbi:alpha-mannosidase [Oscillatoria sp. FACHB-1407]|uniref:alpha-mannosidase n=1 Tax=Oscillatoria sp. FACHB-1407 TaxID=2692847 RepID=UPI001681C889|nr:alpha-mannosidase [Oscillatoria sp. FACHB-1407]MBD2462638.1 alpha-mannosidase [Oscillatoria sp. FACHB-1407]